MNAAARQPSMRLAVLATVMLLTCAFTTIYAVTRQALATNQRELQVQQLCAEIARLDEVLTMSTWVAATTGDDRWRRRYDAHVEELDAAINELREVSPIIFDHEFGADTAAANARLVAAEGRVYDLVAAGDLPAARLVLEGADYLLDKQAYAAGNEHAQGALRDFVAAETSATHSLSGWLICLTIALALFVAAAWFRVFRTSDAIQNAARLELVRAEQIAAEASSNAKSHLVANVSHELRTPLTAILGYADLLRDVDYPEGDRVAAAGTIERHGRHLLQVINDLLDMSKIEAGAMQIHACSTDPALLVDDVLSLLRVRAHEKDIALERTFATSVPRSVQTDPVRVRQILVNLIGNAIKFTSQGEVRVTMWFDHDAPVPQLRVAVRDTGIGMTEEQAGRLFRPFEQGDSTTERRFGGTGLGLTIARHYAHLLRGEIAVSSVEGQGSTFTLTVPLQFDEPPSLWNPDGATLGPVAGAGASACNGVEPADLTGLQILLAEDGADNQRLLSYLLRRAGAEVVVAENGRCAVEFVTAEGKGLNLVLMDMQMPVLDGYQATAQLREQGCTLPIIALTANAMSTDRERCLLAGCDDYMTKPVDRVALLAMCARWAATQPA